MSEKGAKRSAKRAPRHSICSGKRGPECLNDAVKFAVARRGSAEATIYNAHIGTVTVAFNAYVAQRKRGRKEKVNKANWWLVRAERVARPRGGRDHGKVMTQEVFAKRPRGWS